MSVPADAPDLPKRAEKLRKLWLEASVETRAKVEAIAEEFYTSGNVKNQRYHLVLYKKVFVASAFVQWLCSNTAHAATVEEAVAIGELLVASNMVHHAVDDHEFKNEYLYFRYRRDDGTGGNSVYDKLDTATRHGWLFSVAKSGRKLTFQPRYFVVTPPSSTLEFSVASAEEKPAMFYEYTSDLGSTPAAAFAVTPGSTVRQIEGQKAGQEYGLVFKLPPSARDQNGVEATFYVESGDDQNHWTESMIKSGATEDVSTAGVDGAAGGGGGGGGGAAPTDIYGFKALDLNLEEYLLSQSRGRAVLVVNVASY